MPSLSVRKAVEQELARLPEELATSATAASALALADSIDLGTDTYRHQPALVGQLVDCMEKLAEKAPAKVEGDRVDDLNARRAARRSAASAG
jgi:hypothetical protein